MPHTFPVPEFRKPGSSTSFFIAAAKTDEDCKAVHEELPKSKLNRYASIRIQDLPNSFFDDWTEVAIKRLERFEPTDGWSEAIAVGDFTFVHKVQNEVGYKAAQSQVIETGGAHELREQTEVMGANLTVKMRR